MKPITSPQSVTYNPTGDNKADVVIEPCHPGYGVTIGNSLRRVLLSSLDGAAITGFKIVGVDHEFSSIAGVKEDVVDVILNLKKVRVKIYADTEIEEEIKLELKASGVTKITAGDITKNAQVEIANPDQIIATMTNKDTKLEMELFIKQGRGYVTVEQREGEKLEVGTIAIDSFFSPVVNVGFTLDNIRVGEMTNYEKLILNIETDGTITPEEALVRARQILVEQFSVLSSEPLKAKVIEDEVVAEEVVVNDPDELEEKVEALAEEPKTKKRGRPKKIDK